MQVTFWYFCSVKIGFSRVIIHRWNKQIQARTQAQHSIHSTYIYVSLNRVITSKRPDYFFIGATSIRNPRVRLSNNFHVVNTYRPHRHRMDCVAWAEYSKRTSCPSPSRILVDRRYYRIHSSCCTFVARRNVHICAFAWMFVRQMRGKEQ